jgi:DNA-binding response OmpR family regulator
MKILLVEDDRKLSRALATMLDEDGNTVALAYDGERGLELGMENPYDVMILDVMLPRMDGFDVCRTLRANRIETPVLMLTARTAVGDRVDGLDAGADLEVDGLALDLRRRRAEYGGKTMELSPTELALLEVLMRNEGRVMTQAQILDHVWGYDAWPESNLVAVYVTYLRRKFKQLKVPVQIRAIRGVGYVLGT